MKKQKINYDFIEIGTSNFDTLIETCKDDTIGLSIEPLKVYLDTLPNKTNVSKVCTAISDEDGEIEIYNIPLTQIHKYNLPIWVKGCNSVSKPHEYAKKTLGEEFYDSVVSVEKVKMMSWKTLISEYNINTIKYLKIDTEGHDHVILKSYIAECNKNPKLFADKILFEYNESSNKVALDELISSLKNYNSEYLEQDVVLTKIRHDKAYVLYASENYFDIVYSCVKSIRTFSKLPVLVYLLDSDKKVDIENVTTIKWIANSFTDGNRYLNSTDNFYIDRTDENIYKLLIQRPMIVKDALENYAKVVAYIDSDSVATQYCDRIFDMYDASLNYPYFVEGIYDYLHINGRGGAETREDMSTTLEHPACELFGVNQYIRQKYRQTGYFVAGQNTIDFLEEWYWMCTHPKVLKDFQHYAPYHEETIANVLLWKYNRLDGLPYIYVNADNQKLNQIFDNNEFTGHPKNIGPWFKIPSTEKDLLFIHGEKRPQVIEEMIEILKSRPKKLREYPNIKPEKNWGDIISKFILEHFSGKKLKNDDVFHFDEKRKIPFKDGKIIGAGSSMVFTKPNDYVWGTGCIDEYSMGDKPKKVYSVRGPLTRNLLTKIGWDIPEIYGDPALLFPKIYNPKITKKYTYGLIPHFVDYNTSHGLESINELENLGVKIINVTAGIYEFIDQILECEFILSSSLHGLIAADAYQIPNFRVVISDLILGGGFKYLDYYASVSRQHYTPLQLHPKLKLEDIESLKFEVGDISIVDKLLDNSPWNDPSCEYFNSPDDKNLKVLYLAPHLSTGGMPGFLLKRIQAIKEYHEDVELFVAEHGFYSDKFIVQRNKIIDIIGEDKFWSLGKDKMKLIDIIKDNNIDIVHVDEMIEGFDTFNKVPNELMNALYDNNRTWRMVETCHNVSFNPTQSKKFNPDAYAFCTPYHKEVTFKEMPSYGEVLEFPIDNNFRTEDEKLKFQNELNLDPSKTHILNVGLWTSGKNQGEGIEIAKHLKDSNVEFHFVGNQAPNFKEYWEPLMNNLPDNVRIWGERNDVEKFMKASDILMFNSTWECNPLVIREAASYGLKILARDLPQYLGMFDELITPLTNDISENVQTLKSLINSKKIYNIEGNQSSEFASAHYNLYNNILSKKPMENIKNNSNINITQYFINQPFLEITGESDRNYEIKFFDEQGVCNYENNIKSNHWVKLNREYFTKWNTKIWEDGNLIYDKTLDYKNKRVFINFDSKSLGDNIAWMPYVLEFQNVHECKVIVCTYWNNLFKKVYPELEFVYPGSTVPNIHGQYNIGWFYNENKEPQLPNTIPLQQSATNILGLPFKEIKPKISYKIGERPYKQKYVTIATNSTSGCKFWTKEAWQELINHLHSLGYKIINVSKEDNPFKNVSKIKDTSIENTMNVIHHSEFFIGLSSGLSWLAWAIGKHVVMISNFTEANHEFTSNCTRITNLSVCNGCWNNPNFKFDKGDWDWCPVHKGTSRQFECHTSITSEMVINQIKELIK
jgi:autotransporter strand-loop-strand O-heptosyltransferase